MDHGLLFFILLLMCAYFLLNSFKEMMFLQLCLFSVVDEEEEEEQQQQQKGAQISFGKGGQKLEGQSHLSFKKCLNFAGSRLIWLIKALGL